MKNLQSLFSLILICITSSVFGQLPDTLIKKIDGIFLDYDKTNSPGCALAILKDGRIIYKRGYGMSNMEYNIAISPSSIFHIASISKQFSAAALVKLALEGKLSLNDDIRKYIPEVPDFGHTITINNLIHHTSGIRDQWDLQGLAGWRDDDLITEKDILEMLARQKNLNFLPGDEYLYCNTGFTLAGVIVRKVTGISLREYADSVFFKPLGMNSTHFHSDHSEITPNRTSAYYKDDKGKWKISIPVFDNYGATSLFTTVEDLAKWDENFYTKMIGGNAFVEAMQLTGQLNDGTPQNYASGLVLDTYKGYKTIGHGGADAGYRSNYLRLPDEHFSVIVFANLANINTQDLSNRVVDLFYRDKRANKPTFKNDNTILKKWKGDYFNTTRQSNITVDFKNDKLLFRSNELVPTTDFIFNAFNSTFTFNGDSTNTQLTITTKGTKPTISNKIKKIKLSTAELKEYQGDFYSTELETKYIISVKDSSLQIKIPRNVELEVSPLIKDIFFGDLNIRFSRNKKKSIDGFFLSTGRVRNLRFAKMNSKSF
jgi:CubicO group peptidase (beta-lactamase class C family)